MAALGTLPTKIVLKKAAPPPPAVSDQVVGSEAKEATPSRKIGKIVVKQRPNTTQNTPAPANALQSPAVDLDNDAIYGDDEMRHAASARARRRATAAKDIDDDDYEPTRGAVASHPSASSASPAAPDVRGPSTPVPATRPKVTRSSLSRASFSHQDSSLPSTPMTRANADREAMDRIVELAVDEALRHYRYPTAFALRTLYDEKASDSDFMSMLEAIINQTADVDTLKRYRNLMHDKKVEGKLDNQGCYYFVSPAANNSFTPHKPKPAPYANLLKTRLLSVDQEEEHDADAHVSKKPRLDQHNRSSPKKMANGNGNGLADDAAASSMSIDSPSRNGSRERAGSVDSMSSLSSAQSLPAPEELEEPSNGSGLGVSGVPQTSASAAELGEAASTSASAHHPQPMGARKRSIANKKSRGQSPVSKTHSRLVSTPGAHHANSSASTRNGATPSMPSAVDTGVHHVSLSTTKKGRHTNGHSEASPAPGKAPSQPAAAAAAALVDEHDELRQRLRRESRNVTNGHGAVPVSNARGTPLSGRDEPERELEATPVAPSRPSRISLRNTRSARKRSRDDGDEEQSPVAPLFPPPPIESMSSARNSRPATPAGGGPRQNRQRTGLRVKTSPVKSRTGPSAGVPRASGERGSPMVNGASNNQDDNDDYCASCGASGELVCCDGCVRSFHFICVDPPFLQEAGLPDEWYCNTCISTRFPASVPHHSGVFGHFLNMLEKKNSSAFRLPADIRDCFEGVKTGSDGEYEEVVAPVSKTKKRGQEEPMEVHKIVDAEGRPVLCHGCDRSAESNKPIIPCSACSLHWHLDCVDPPMANPPVLRTWRCPAHVDELLIQLPPSLAPAHKHRRLKNAPAIKSIFSRGMRNNGFIEIVDDDDQEAPVNGTGWKDPQSFGRLHKVSARGVQLDFLDQARKKRLQQRQRDMEAASAAAVKPRAVLADRRPIDHAQATQNMSALQGTHMQQPGDRTRELIKALLSEADPNVIALMANGNALNIESGHSLTEDDKQSLRAMQAMISRLLGSSGADKLATATDKAAYDDNVASMRAYTPSTVVDATGADVGDTRSLAARHSTDMPTPSTSPTKNTVDDDDAAVPISLQNPTPQESVANEAEDGMEIDSF